MRIRPRMLPPGWYPGTKGGCESEIARFIQGAPPLPAGTPVYGGLVPHAGWYFSGKLAARVFHLNALAAQPQVVCIFGGHLSGASLPLLVNEDAWETPYGALLLATEFYAPLRERISLREEHPGDNTIEVNLPFAAHFFPNAKVLALRAPQSSQAIELGAAVAAVAQELNRTLLCFGSADLTHYGLNYGFAPRGYGPDAVQWVKEKNDKRFLDRILAMDAPGAIRAADEDQSSCSAGGPAAAMAAAQKLGATQALLVDYYTSYDIMPGDSFVGYGGVVWAS
jgi:MEMO1 family protein